MEAVIIHSTNNGNSGRDFNSELGWAADDCNRFFTHYYIDRDGNIYQVVDDLLVTFHTGSTNFGVNNGNARLTMRDIDIATGAEIETLRHSFIAAGPHSQVVCTASGAHGGLGFSNGNGGAGGNAGSFTLIGGTLNPAPSQFVNIHEIRRFPPGDPMQQEDDSCSSGRITVGQAVEARDVSGMPLYRVRISTSGTSLLGGLGGIPSQAGVVGALGTSGAISGLPVQ